MTPINERSETAKEKPAKLPDVPQSGPYSEAAEARQDEHLRRVLAGTIKLAGDR